MSWYYVDTQGITKGPYTVDKLKAFAGTEINPNTYIWNGTTVPQWTQISQVPELQDLYMDTVKTNGSIVWGCNRCISVADNTPQICYCCGSPTTFKIKCHECQPIFILNNIDAKSCIKCGKALKAVQSVEEMESKEELRQNNVFLRRCNNFKTNEENVSLLVYGFINSEIKHVTPDIIEICLAFSYNIDKIKCYQDKLVKKDFSKRFLDFKPYYVGKNVLTKRMIRKLWRIKASHSNNIQHKMSLRIGFKEATVPVSIQNDDIVSVLWMMSRNTDHATLSFAINGKRCDDISLVIEITSKATGLRITDVFPNSTKIELL